MNRPDDVPSVHDAFERQAQATPDAPAVSCAREVWSYARLNATANGFGRALSASGVAPGARVGLYAPRSAERVAMMLAIAKAGAAYVPLDAALPAERLRRIAAGARVRTVACAPASLWAGEHRVVVLDATSAVTSGQSAENLGVEVGPDDVFYVPFTSGSTGEPKGVDVPHRSIPGFFRGGSWAEWGPGHVWAHHTSMSWDGHIFEIYPSLLTGGQVVVLPPAVTDPVDVVRAARDSGVTAMFLSTQAFNTVVDLDLDALRGLRQVVIGGEKASPRHVSAAAGIPGLALTNAYGPVECTALVTAHSARMADATTDLPLGRQVGDRRVHVVDDAGTRVPDDVVGELCIGGPGVAHGYVDDPRRTAEKFVPDPFGGEPGGRVYRTGDLGTRRPDGVFTFAGRRDAQIKLRGFRIELGEIESELRRYPAVSDATVVLDPDGPAGPRLLAFLLADADVQPDDARAWLATRLPAAMVPAAVTVVPRFPLTSNGKLDRMALLLQETTSASHAGYEPPATPTERGLAELFGEQLGVAQVGRHDDFFALGGHSLLASRVIARVRERFSAELTVRELYEAPTLTEFAALVDATRTTGGRSRGIPRLGRADSRTAAGQPVEAGSA